MMNRKSARKPLKKSPTRKAYHENVQTEERRGKSLKKAKAVASSVRSKAKAKAKRASYSDRMR